MTSGWSSAIRMRCCEGVIGIMIYSGAHFDLRRQAAAKAKKQPRFGAARVDTSP
jgi:hypothetical protein